MEMSLRSASKQWVPVDNHTSHPEPIRTTALDTCGLFLESPMNTAAPESQL